MRGTVLVVVTAVVALALAVAWHEFAVGLQGYAPLPRDGDLGGWTLVVGTQGQTITLHAPSEPTPLAVPLPPGEPVLVVETLTPGVLGRVVGLEPLVKLSGVGVGSDAEDALGGFTPLHGGTDGCWQILELTGALGRMVARPDRVLLRCQAAGGGQGRVVVHEGRLRLTP